MRETKERFAKIAKLLAEENIHVSFERVETASFDLDNRVLRLPVFGESLPDDVYGMMVAHEVSHALNTPNDSWREWVAPERGGSNVRASYANVIEDVRIERLIKKRFPGVVREMQAGYDVLHNNNFFGLEKNEDLSQRQLIDRINLHFKSYGHLNVPFTEEEKVWLEKIESAETFDDVLSLSRELIEHQKEENRKEQVDSGEETPENNEDNYEKNEENDPGSSSEDGDESDEDDDEEDSETTLSSSDDDLETDEGDVEEDNDSVEGDGEEEEEASNGDSSEGVNDEDDEDNTSAGDESLDEVQTDSAMNQSFKDATENSAYANRTYHINEKFIKNHYDSYIVSPERLMAHQFGNLSNAELFLMHDLLQKNMREAIAKNKKYVQKLVSEFERKHSARVMKKAREAKVGSLDMKKLTKYMWNDNLFLTGMETPEGQSHGIVMMVDFSGSMNSIMNNVMKQVFNMITFCERLNIPYEVYAFSNAFSDDEHARLNELAIRDHDLNRSNYLGSVVPDYSTVLLNILSSHSSKKTKTMVRSWLAFSTGFLVDDIYHVMNTLPRVRNVWSGLLSSTPLNSALALSPELMVRFRRKTGVQKVHYLLFSDGGASDTAKIIGEHNHRIGLGAYLRNFSILDETTNHLYNSDKIYNSGQKMFSMAQTILTQRIANIANTNMVGFFLIADHGRSNNRFNEGIRKVMGWSVSKKMNEMVAAKIENNHGVVTFQNVGGFNHYTFVSSKVISPVIKDIEDMYRGKKSLSEASVNTVATAFSKTNNHNNATRFLVRDIIDAVA